MNMTPLEALEEMRDTLEAELEPAVSRQDDGIGSYEFWGCRGNDSHPYLLVTIEGQVDITWVCEECPDNAEEFTATLYVDETALTTTFTPVGDLEVEETEDGFQVTQTFAYEGEGSREDDGSEEEPDLDEYDD